MQRSVFVLALATVVLVAACGGGAARPRLIAAGETPRADASDGQLASSVIAGPDTAFRVEFAWTEGAPGGKTGAFIWAQAGGVRRWDLVPEGADAAAIGWFSVESGFSAVGTPASTVDCLWEHTDGPNVRVGCDAVRPGHPGADALTRAYTSLRLSGRVRDRTIAGRTAACYVFKDGKDTDGLVCVDAADRTPLLFAATGFGRNEAFHTFEATAVMAPPIAVPTPANAPTGTVLKPVARDAANLALPPEFHLAK
jgi:hypothetical protein